MTKFANLSAETAQVEVGCAYSASKGRDSRDGKFTMSPSFSEEGRNG